MRTGESRFGILALLGGSAIMLVLLVALARYPTLVLRGDRYEAVFASIQGLNRGDDVRYGGLRVGAVSRLEIDPHDPSKIRASIRVRRGTPVTTQTRATITQVGLLGEPFLNLDPGGGGGPPLEVGSTIPSEPMLSFQDAVNRLASFFDRADTLMTGIERLAEGEPWERVDRTLASVESLVDNTATSSERLFVSLERAGERVNTVLDRSERAIVTLDTALRSSAPGLAEAQREALAAMRELNILVADLRDAMQTGGGMEQLIRNVSTAAENMARLTARLERDPGSLLQPRGVARKTAGPALRD